MKLQNTDEIEDIPSPIDLRVMADALDWEQTALSKRPQRTLFFKAFADQISAKKNNPKRILELGSGPGFLAEYLLNSLPDLSYTLFDFSASMHQLARARLGSLCKQAQFIERSFREDNWQQGLTDFNIVVTHQAVHELRHKRYAIELHRQVHTVLTQGGSYLVCDHFVGEGGMKNDQLYMTTEEQIQALHAGGFKSVEQVLLEGGLVLHHAVK